MADETKIDPKNESLNNLIKWKSTQLNIGVMGSSSTHKESLIKSFACVKSPEALDDITDYEFIKPTKPVGHVHSNNENIIFWEMPECDELGKNEYIDLFQIERYDLLLICQCGSKPFDENELWIAQQLKSRNVNVFFVKIKSNVSECTNQNVMSEIEAIDRLEFQIIEKINNEFVEINEADHDNFYSVSNNDVHKLKFDFSKLNIDLMSSLTGEKKEAFIFSIEPFSKDIIREKHELLKSKTHHSAVVSTLCGIFTHIIPGVGLVVDLAFLVKEITFYLAQFGLNDDSLSKISKQNNIAYDELVNIISKSAYASLILLKDLHALTSTLIKVLPIFAAANAADSIKIFPVVGHIIHGSISFLMTKYALLKILDEFSGVALDISAYIEQNGQQNQTDDLDTKSSS